jgi:putative tryptophan/tyrosine transport system substrate-binding protein
MRVRAALPALVALLALAGGPASAQPAQKVWRLGFLSPSFSDSAVNSRRSAVAELGRLGFVEGRNLVVEERYAEGELERLPDLAREIAQSHPDVIIAVTPSAIRAAKEAAPDTPIVMAFAGEDPVAGGLVASLARPGGTVTGIALLASEGDAKRVELTTQALPNARHIALLASKDAEDRVTLAHETATSLGLQITTFRAAGPPDYDLVFPLLRAGQPQALVLGSAPVFFRDAQDLALRAAALRLPMICQWREMARAGCVLSYGPSIETLYRRVAAYVARIFQGAAPAELPVEQPTTFELVVNLKAAKAIGVEIAPSFLARADEVIE